MTPEILRSLMDSTDPWALFDVREAGEAESGHIPGATFLPRRMIEFRIAELVGDRDTRIVVYDEGGERACFAAQTLNELGYGNTSILEGGLADWTASGGEVIQGSNVPSKLFGERILEECQVPQVTADELAALIEQDDVIICDIRTLREHRNARIPGAWYAGSFDVALAAADLAGTGRKVVCHCAGRTRSIIGAQTLREFGVENACALKDGTMGWVLSGRELEEGPVQRELVASPDSIKAVTAIAEQLVSHAGVDWCDVDELDRMLQARANLQTNAYIFDVRQLEAYEKAHIPGAQALPGGQAVLRTDDFVSVRNAPVVFVDDGVIRAATTAHWFRRMGYNVAICRDALKRWQASGRTLEPGRGRRLPLGLTEARRVSRSLPPRDAQAIIEKDDAIVIDVDNSKSFAAGHLPGAHWAQRGWLEREMPTIAPEKSTPILVTCGQGLQSIFASVTLQRLGYSDVRHLEGGVDAWRKAELPVQKGLPEGKDSEPSDQVLPPYARGKKGMARYLSWEKQLTSNTKP